MANKPVFVFVMLASLFFHAPWARGESGLPTSALAVVDETVVEVVTPKLPDGAITYEKPLPLDLVPYKLRTDKFFSIGTAFAVSKSQFVSAAHIFNLQSASQYRDFFIRDKKGRVYEVDQVLRYSDHKDFVVFTAKGKTVGKTLEFEKAVKMNETVFAVGNAFGDGIIIRNGVLTSKTPEDENGQWEWLRFSAAVSPGNSGGPLLDARGRVIGLVTAKSENENLNFALPISEPFSPKENGAVSHIKFFYRLENTSKQKYAVYDYTASLPKPYKALREELSGNFFSFVAETLEDLLEENGASMFPNGKGSTALLHDFVTAFFPNLICEDETGNWKAFYPSETKKAELPGNGSLEYGGMAGITFARLRKPDDAGLSDLVRDQKLYMDMVLKGIPVYRTVMGQDVRITSLGKPVEEEVHVDSYRRKWLVGGWLMPYDDTKLLCFSTPVPGGMVAMLALDYTDKIDNGYKLDLKYLADFVYLSYYGTFREWAELLSLGDRLPDALNGMRFAYSPGERASLSTARLAFDYTVDLQDIGDDSDMALRFGYFPDNGKVVWDIRGVSVGVNKDSDTFLSIVRELKPSEGLDDSYFDEWETIVRMKPPFNGKPFNDENVTRALAVHESFTSGRSANVEAASHLYTVGVHVEGAVKPKKIKKKLGQLQSAVRFTEGAVP